MRQEGLVEGALIARLHNNNDRNKIRTTTLEPFHHAHTVRKQIVHRIEVGIEAKCKVRAAWSIRPYQQGLQVSTTRRSQGCLGTT